MLSERILVETMKPEKVSLYAHWISECIKIQKRHGSNRFLIQSMKNGMSVANPSDLTLHYEICNEEIKLIKE